MRKLINKKFYTTGDIAEFFGVSRIAAYKWVKKGKIEAFRIPGGRYKIERKSLLEFAKKSGLKANILEKDKEYKILIVDDEELITQSIKTFLESKYPTFYINIASDGFEAGRLITKTVPDIIILDLFLPGVNGFQLCRKIKSDENTKHIKIIAITGYPTEENVAKIKECGADAVLGKPFEMDELEKNIKKLIE